MLHKKQMQYEQGEGKASVFRETDVNAHVGAQANTKQTFNTCTHITMLQSGSTCINKIIISDILATVLIFDH